MPLRGRARRLARDAGGAASPSSAPAASASTRSGGRFCAESRWPRPCCRRAASAVRSGSRSSSRGGRRPRARRAPGGRPADGQGTFRRASPVEPRNEIRRSEMTRRLSQPPQCSPSPCWPRGCMGDDEGADVAAAGGLESGVLAGGPLGRVARRGRGRGLRGRHHGRRDRVRRRRRPTRRSGPSASRRAARPRRLRSRANSEAMAKVVARAQGRRDRRGRPPDRAGLGLSADERRRGLDRRLRRVEHGARDHPRPRPGRRDRRRGRRRRREPGLRPEPHGLGHRGAVQRTPWTRRSTTPARGREAIAEKAGRRRSARRWRSSRAAEAGRSRTTGGAASRRLPPKSRSSPARRTSAATLTVTFAIG